MKHPTTIQVTVLATLIGMVLATCVAVGHAETIADEKLGFTLELPDHLQPAPEFVSAEAGVAHAFKQVDAKGIGTGVLVFFEPMGGVIGRERLKRENMPVGFEGELIIEKWQGFEVDGIVTRTSVLFSEVVAYQVQVPLKGEAIQIIISGPVAQEKSLKRLLSEILGNLEGESNWLSTVAPGGVANSPAYPLILLSATIVGVLFGLVMLWLVSRVTPRGTVLGVAIAIYVASWFIDDGGVSELRVLTGMLRLLGVAGGVMGVILVFWPRKKKSANVPLEPNRDG